MSYTLLKIATYYRDFLKQYYNDNPNIINESYDKQFEHLMSQEFGWANYYSKSLNKLGVEAYEIVANAKHLQHQWARENNINFNENKILLSQIKTLKPDVIWFQDSFSYNGDFIKELRQKFPFIKLIIGYCCAPYTKEHVKLFKAFDFLITCSPFLNEEFNKQGINSYHIYHAFNGDILNKIQQQKKVNDLIFIGNIVAIDGFHDKRRFFFEELLKKNVSFNFYGQIQTNSTYELIKKRILYTFKELSNTFHLQKYFDKNKILKKAYLLNEFPKKIQVSKELLNIQQQPVFGLEMFEKIAQAKIAFNIHIDATGDNAVNMRLFETIGMGTCILTDNKKNIRELFEPGKEVVVFNDIDDFVEKVNWLLEHSSEREKIAEAGQKRILSDHNFDNRAKQLHKIITNKLK